MAAQLLAGAPSNASTPPSSSSPDCACSAASGGGRALRARCFAAGRSKRAGSVSVLAAPRLPEAEDQRRRSARRLRRRRAGRRIAAHTVAHRRLATRSVRRVCFNGSPRGVPNVEAASVPHHSGLRPRPVSPGAARRVRGSLHVETKRAVLAESHVSGPRGRARSLDRRHRARRGVHARAVRARGRGRRRRARPRLGAPPPRFDAALAELDAGAAVPVGRLAPALVAAARPRAPAVAGRAAAGRRHGALRPPGRRAVRHADRAARRGAAQRRPERRRRRPSRSPRWRRPAIPGGGGPRGRRRARGAAGLGGRAGRRGGGRAARGAARGPERRPSASGSSTPRAPARRSPRSGFVEASRTGGVADPHPPPQPRRPVPRRAARPRLRASASRPRCCAARTAPTAR